MVGDLGTKLGQFYQPFSGSPFPLPLHQLSPRAQIAVCLLTNPTKLSSCHLKTSY